MSWSLAISAMNSDASTDLSYESHLSIRSFSEEKVVSVDSFAGRNLEKPKWPGADVVLEGGGRETLNLG